MVVEGARRQPTTGVRADRPASIVAPRRRARIPPLRERRRPHRRAALDRSQRPPASPPPRTRRPARAARRHLDGRLPARRPTPSASVTTAGRALAARRGRHWLVDTRSRRMSGHRITLCPLEEPRAWARSPGTLGSNRPNWWLAGGSWLKGRVYLRSRGSHQGRCFLCMRPYLRKEAAWLLILAGAQWTRHARPAAARDSPAPARCVQAVGSCPGMPSSTATATWSSS